MKSKFDLDTIAFLVCATTLIVLCVDGHMGLDLLDVIIERIQDGTH